MKNIFKNRRLLIGVVVIAIIAVGLKISRGDSLGLERIIPSLKQTEATETVFVQISKQFAVTVPQQWSVIEPVNGRQTLIYPTDAKISASDAQTLLGQDVVIVETAINKKDSFETLVNDLKTSAEQEGSTATVENKTYGKLTATKLQVAGKVNYQQIFFNTPTVIIVTAKTDHPIFEKLAESITIDLSTYASDIAQATNLTRATTQNIATGKFTDIYNTSSDNLKKQKTVDEFNNLFIDISPDFTNNALIWGIYINSNGLGSAVNIVDQGKIIRRSSFYYAKNKDTYLLDALRISGRITYPEANPPG